MGILASRKTLHHNWKVE